MSKQALIEQDDNLFRNEGKSLTFNIVDADGATVSMSEWTLAYVMEELHDAAANILSKVSGSGITVENGAGEDDRAVVAISATETVDLEPRVYRQALWRTDGDDPQLLAQGSIMIQAAAQVDEVSS